MMKIAWLVWYNLEDKQAGERPEFWTVEPDSWRTFTRIVYCEVSE